MTGSGTHGRRIPLSLEVETVRGFQEWGAERIRTEVESPQVRNQSCPNLYLVLI